MDNASGFGICPSLQPVAKIAKKLEKSQFLLLCANLDISGGFRNTHPLDSDLSGGLCYPTFEQPDV